MNQHVVIAQADANSSPTSSPVKTVRVVKPGLDQAITLDLGFDQKTKLDLSEVANEKMTLVHVGTKLIILFDNQSTVTVEPFFDSNGKPLGNLDVDLGAGRDVTGDQFASIFPITDDQSVLPAAGNGAGGPASGADFHSPAIDALNGGNPLALLGQEDLGTFATDETLPPQVQNDIKPSVAGKYDIVVVREADLDNTLDVSPPLSDLSRGFTQGTDAAGRGETVVVKGVTFSAGSEAIDVTLDPASITVTDGAGNPVKVFWVVSKGGIHLEGFLTDPSSSEGSENPPHPAIVIEIVDGADGSHATHADANGTVSPVITVTLTDQFPHSDSEHSGTADVVTISGLTVVATDSSGDVATAPLTIEIADDAPVTHDSLPSAGGEEQSSAVIDDQAQAHGNFFNNHGDDNGTNSVSGQLDFDAGADHVRQIAFVNAGGQPELTVTADDGSHPALQAIYVDANGIGTPEAVTLTWQSNGAGGGTLTGTSAHFTGEGNQNPVFTLTVDSSGHFTYTAYAPLAQPLHTDGAEGSTQTAWEDNINLAFTYTVTDGDGDHSSSVVTINVDDDIPTVVAATSQEGGLPIVTLDESIGADPHDPNTSPDSDDTGSAAPFGHAVIAGSVISGLFIDSAGADGEKSHTFGFALQNGSGSVVGVGATPIATNLSITDAAHAYSNDTIYLTQISATQINGVIAGADGLIGTADDKLALTITIDPTSGAVSVDQYLAIRHSVAGSSDAAHDDTVTLSLGEAGGIFVSHSLTDGDGDVASATSSASLTIRIEDDGPSVTAVLNQGFSLVHDETLLLQSPNDILFTSVFNNVAHPGHDPDVAFGLPIGYARSAGAALTVTGVDYGTDGAANTGKQVFSLNLFNADNTVATNPIDSGLQTTDHHEIFLFKEGNLIVGRYDAANGSVTGADPAAFAIAIDPVTGVVSLVQYVSLYNSDSSNPNDVTPLSVLPENGSLKATVTVTDGDGDTASASADLSGTIQFRDDGPSVVAGVNLGFDIVADETHGNQADDVTGPLSVFDHVVDPGHDPDNAGNPLAFATDNTPALGVLPYFGVDGAATSGAIVYTLTLHGEGTVASGLRVTDGATISLHAEIVDGQTMIVGRVDSGDFAGKAAFAIAIDPVTGQVSVVEYLSIQHNLNGASPNDVVTLASDTVYAVVTVKDGDGDTDFASGDISGRIHFRDDGPSVTAVLNQNFGLVHDETLLLQSPNDILFTSVFNSVGHVGHDPDVPFGLPIGYARSDAAALTVTGVDYGADGAATANKQVFSLNLFNAGNAVATTPIDSGLQTTDHHEIFLFKEGNLIVGRYDTANGAVTGDDPAAFAIAIDPATGVVSLVQYVSLYNSNSNDPNDITPLSILPQNGSLKATVTVTDGDGDTASASADLSGTIQFRDDGPSVVAGVNLGFDITIDESHGNQANDVTGPLSVFDHVVDPGHDPDNAGNPLAFARDTTPALGVLPPYFGVDGAATSGAIVYTLALHSEGGVASGLKVTDGSTITLHAEIVDSQTMIVGRVDSGDFAGKAAFAIAIDPVTGQVSVVEYLSIQHNLNGASPNDVVTLASDTVYAVVTVKDGDGDTSSSSGDISGRIHFRDDGPSVSISATGANVAIDETPGVQTAADPNAANDVNYVDLPTAIQALFDTVTNAGSDPDVASGAKDHGAISFAISSGALVSVAPTFGVDGPSTGDSQILSLSINGGNGAASGLALTDNSPIKLYLEHGVIIGRVQGGDFNGQAAFAIAIGQDGRVAVVEYLSLKNPTGGSSYDELAVGLKNVLATVMITDGDNDSATKSVDISSHIQFQDDGPSLSVITPAVIGGLDFGNFQLNGNEWGTGSGVAKDTSGSWTIANSDSGQGGGGDVQLERVGDGYQGMHSSTKGYMVDLDASPHDVKITQTLTGLVNGQTYDLRFEAGAPFPNSAHLEVWFGGSRVADIAPGSQMQEYVISLTGGYGNGSNLLEFRETGTPDNQGTYLANVSVGTIVIDETAGNDPGSNDVAANTLFNDVAHQGADGHMTTPQFAAGHTAVVSITADFGADGPKGGSAAAGTSYSLFTTDNSNSGLTTTGGKEIHLFNETYNGVSYVVGRYDSDGSNSVSNAGYENGSVADAAAFAFRIDPTTGVLSLVQYVSLHHDNTSSNDEGAFLGAGSLSVSVTITDGDNDTATKVADISTSIRFDDDGPQAVLTLSGITVTIDETIGAQADDVADFIHNPDLLALFNAAYGTPTEIAQSSHSILSVAGTTYGADGQGAAPVFTLTLSGGNGVDSGLDATDGRSVFLFKEGNLIVGREGTAGGVQDPNGAVAFAISLDSSTGVLTVAEYTALHHNNPLDPNESASPLTISQNVIQAAVTVMDGDGDTSVAFVGIGNQIHFLDDGVTLATQGNLIVNGSFEDGHTDLGNGQWSIYNAIDGWKSGDDGVPFEVQTGGAGGVGAQDQNSLIELDSDQSSGNLPGGPDHQNTTGQTDATIQQTVATQVGQTYELTFWYAARPGATAGDSSGMDVLWNGTAVQHISSTGLTAGVWQQYSVFVVGTGSDTVAFHGTGPQDSLGALLDNVSLVPMAVVDEDGLLRVASGGSDAVTGNHDSQIGDANVPDNDNAPGTGGDGNEATATGLLGINWGADNFNGGTDGYSAATGFTQDGSGRSVTFTNTNVGITGGTLTSHGDPISFSLSSDGTKLIGTAQHGTDAPRTVIEVTLSDDNSGAFHVILHDALDHTAGGNENDIVLTFNYTATDSDGDFALGSFKVLVDDDVPVLTGNLASGTVSENAIGGSTPIVQAMTLDFQHDTIDHFPNLSGTHLQITGGSGIAVVNHDPGVYVLQGPDAPTGALPLIITADPGTTFKLNSVALGAFGTGPNTLTLTAYDANGNEITHTTFNPSTLGYVSQQPTALFTAFNNIEISQLVIAPPTSGYSGRVVLDNLSITETTVPVPHPAETTIDLTPLVSVGADSPGTWTLASFSEQQVQFTQGSSVGPASYNGTPITMTSDGHTITGMAGSEKIFTLTVSSDGHATFDLFKPIDGGTLRSIDFSQFVTVTDSDGDRLTLGNGDFIINVTSVDHLPSVSAPSVSVNESGLPPHGVLPAGSGEIANHDPNDNSDKSETKTGTITIGQGDGPSVITINGQAVTDAPDQTFHGQFGTLTITHVSATQIDYSYTLETNTNGEGTHDDFLILVTDVDGQPASTTLTINIVDDVPTANPDTNSVESGASIVTGNVESNDVAGADGIKSIVWDHATTSGGVTTVSGHYGVLTVNADGSYSYHAYPNTSGNDVFNYTITDSDNDPSSSTLTISVSDGRPVPVAATGLVDEAGLSSGSNPSLPATQATGTLDLGDLDAPHVTSISGATSSAVGTTPVTVNGAYGTLSIDQDGHYTYTLTSNDPHHSTQGTGVDGQSDVFHFTVTDAFGNTNTSTITISIKDDIPQVSTSPIKASVAEGGGTNLILMIDTSGSVGDDHDAILQQEKTAAKNLLDSGVGINQVLVVDFASGAQVSGWLSVADAKTYINGLTSGGNTNYDAALQATMDYVNTHATPAASQTIGYFLSDGAPTSGYTIGTSDQATWESFLTTQNISVYGVKFGSTSADSDIAPIAYPNDGNVHNVGIGNGTTLPGYPAAAPHTVSGNVLTGDHFGADGKGNGGGLQSITVGTTVYTYDSSTGHITYNDGSPHTINGSTLDVNTPLGELVFNFATGNYTYSTTANVSSDRTETFHFTIVDGDGDTAGADLQVTIKNAPQAPTGLDLASIDDSGSSNTDNITNHISALTISGKAESGTTVTLFDDANNDGIQNNGEATLGTASVGAGGTFSVDVSLLDGLHHVRAFETDASNNVSPSSSALDITVDTVAPVAVVTGFINDTGVVGDHITSDRTLTITGTAEAGSTVTVFRNNNSIGTTLADQDGNWSLTDGTTLSNGNTYQYTARATDTAGNTGPTSASYAATIDTSAPNASVHISAISDDNGTSSTDFVTNDTTLTVSGSNGNLGTGEKVQISTDGTNWFDVTQVTGTSWSYTDPVTHTSSFTYSVRVVDVAGNVGNTDSEAVTIDTTAPTAAVAITSIVNDTGTSGDFVTSDRTLTVSGTHGSLGSGDVIQISTNGGVTWSNATNVTGSAWSYNDPVTHSDGTFTYLVRVMDRAGNVGNTDSHVVTVDGTAPTVAVDIVDTSLSDGHASSTVTFTFSEAPVGFTSADLTATNGSISNFMMIDSTHYTATFTATDGVSGTGSVAVKSNSYTDLAGNNGGVDTDTVAIDRQNPTVTVNIVDTSLNNADNSSVVTFNFSEAPVGFDIGDITAVGGTISNLTGSGTSYQAIFTANAGVTTTGSVSVAGGTFTDAAGNAGVGGSDTVSISTVNHAPSGTNNTSISMVEDVSYTFKADDFGFNDNGDGDHLAGVVISTLPSSALGSLLLANAAIAAGTFVTIEQIEAGMLTYAPADNVRGNAGDPTFTFAVRDDGDTGGSNVNQDQSPNTITIDMSSTNYQDDTTGSGSNDSTTYSLTSSGAGIHVSLADSGGTNDIVILNTASGGGTTFSDLNFARSDNNLEISWTTSSGSRTLTLLDEYTAENARTELFRFDDGGTFAGHSLGTGNYTIVNGLTGADGVNNLIAGSSASETLTGGNGNDLLFGGGGNDTLIGGAGSDLLVGGLGADHFRYNASTDGGLTAAAADHIYNFDVAQDSIDILIANFAGPGSGINSSTDPSTIFGSSANNTFGSHNGTQDLFHYNTSTGQLLYDSNGSLSGGVTILAVLDNHAAITATNIHLV